MRFGSLVVGVVGLWVLTPVFVLNLLPAGESANWAIRGQFGDLFGAVNSLFSGLAFAGLFWALRLQADQLEMQRTELALQREELKLQRDEMAASRRELANQVRAQEALFRASAAQVAVAAAQARIQAFQWDAYQWNEQSGARSRLAAPVRAIADELDRMHTELMCESFAKVSSD